MRCDAPLFSCRALWADFSRGEPCVCLGKEAGQVDSWGQCARWVPGFQCAVYGAALEPRLNVEKHEKLCFKTTVTPS